MAESVPSHKGDNFYDPICFLTSFILKVVCSKVKEFSLEGSKVFAIRVKPFPENFKEQFFIELPPFKYK